jgi:hypothetical protein
MKKHLENLSANIDRFVDEFTRKNPIEYHLAVVSVHDHRTYDSKAYKEKFAQASGFESFENGEFRPVKDGPQSVIKNKYFISSTDKDVNTLLKNTLKIGVQDLNKGGPEFEESFSPVAAAFGLPNGDKLSAEKSKRQSDFFFGPSAYKIIFFITDATDDSALSASEFYYELVAQAGGDTSKIMAFGALVPSSEDAKTCPRDPGGAPEKIENFLGLTGQENSNIISLCSHFGDKLAEFGKSIRARTMPTIIHLTQSVPVINDDPSTTLRVFYGSQEIPFEKAPGIKGFRYDPNTNSVHLNPSLELTPEPGAKLSLKYTSVNPVNLQTSQIRRYGNPK